jgi:hypothetical protein
MAQAMQAASAIDPETCRSVARARFSLDAMIGGYVGLYREVIRRASAVSPAPYAVSS